MENGYQRRKKLRVNVKYRRGGPKVKTGCKTCKIRRVKCDEEKPSCLRCTSTGRHCDGYPPQEARPSQRRIIPSSTIFHQPFSRDFGNAQERSMIEAFCSHRAIRICAHFNQDLFWQRSVPQLAHREPAIWYAVLALNSIYERVDAEYQWSKGLPARTYQHQHQNNDAFAMGAYNKAIRYLLKKNDARSKVDICISLAACILFVCVEFMRGDGKGAIKHLKGGHHMLENIRPLSSQQKPRPAQFSFTSASINELLEEIATVFERLRVQVILVDPLFLPPTKPITKPQFHHFPAEAMRFSNLAEARSRIFDLSQEAMLLIFATEPLRYGPVISPSHMMDQLRLEQDFRSLGHAVEQLSRENASTWGATEVQTAHGLIMHALIISIWISCCLSPLQTAFDAFMPEFQKVIELGEEAVKRADMSSFQCDPGIIPPLEFTSYKCRSPVLRRRAMRVLASARWREGTFDSHRAYRRCHRIIEIEEKSLFRDAREKNVDQIYPTEEVRVHSSIVPPFDPVSGRYPLRLIFIPNGMLEAKFVLDNWLPTLGELPSLEPISGGIDQEKAQCEGTLLSMDMDDRDLAHAMIAAGPYAEGNVLRLSH